MKNKQFAVRIEIQLYEELEDEAKSRGQSVTSLIRTFIRDGLSGYAASNDQSPKSADTIEDTLKVLVALAGASLWSAVESRASASVGKDGKSDSEYRSLLVEDYSKILKYAVNKGRQIGQATADNKI